MSLETTLKNTVADLKEVSVTVSITNLKLIIDELTADKDFVHDTLYDLENSLNDLNQYSQRNNFEIQNIPETMLQKNLEKYTLGMLQSIGVKVESYDLVAVHRLGKFFPNKNRNVEISEKSVYLFKLG